MNASNSSVKGPGTPQVWVWGTSALVLVFTYAFPRILLSTLGMENPWTSYVYHYGFGGLFFLIGMVLIVRSRACQLGRGSDTLWFNVMMFGFFAYLFVHGAWILASLYLPLKEGM